MVQHFDICVACGKDTSRRLGLVKKFFVKKSL